MWDMSEQRFGDVSRSDGGITRREKVDSLGCVGYIESVFMVKEVLQEGLEGNLVTGTIDKGNMCHEQDYVRTEVK